VKVLVIRAHPLDESFNAALHQAVLEGLKAAGHEIDNLDLYAENFQPVLSAEERRNYHDLTRNRIPAASYIERLQHTEAVVFVFPTWSFGVPAILKGWFDRVLIPGVSFTLDKHGVARPALRNVKRIAAVTTYGRPWWFVRLLIGDLPRRQICGYFRAVCRWPKATYLALYDMNRATQQQRERFLVRVRTEMARF
jgi:putative NADPH-quinone reductase